MDFSEVLRVLRPLLYFSRQDPWWNPVSCPGTGKSCIFIELAKRKTKVSDQAFCNQGTSKVQQRYNDSWHECHRSSHLISAKNI